MAFNSARVVGPALAGVIIAIGTGATGVGDGWRRDQPRHQHAHLRGRADQPDADGPPARSGATKNPLSSIRRCSRACARASGMRCAHRSCCGASCCSAASPPSASTSRSCSRSSPDDVLGLGAAGYGGLYAAMGVGSLAGSLTLAFMSSRRAIPLMLGGGLVFSTPAHRDCRVQQCLGRRSDSRRRLLQHADDQHDQRDGAGQHPRRASRAGDELLRDRLRRIRAARRSLRGRRRRGLGSAGRLPGGRGALVPSRSASSPWGCGPRGGAASSGSRAWTAQQHGPCPRRTGGTRRLSGALSGRGAAPGAPRAPPRRPRAGLRERLQQFASGREQVPAHRSRPTTSGLREGEDHRPPVLRIVLPLDEPGLARRPRGE